MNLNRIKEEILNNILVNLDKLKLIRGQIVQHANQIISFSNKITLEVLDLT